MPGSDDSEAPRMVEVGRLGKPHGLLGYVTLHSYTRPRDNILDYSPWFVRRHGRNEQIVLADVRADDATMRVRLEGTEDRDAAAALTGLPILVRRTDLPPAADDGYYWVDLIGCEVVDRQRGALGAVDGLLETGEHDTLVIRSADGSTCMIPFVEGVYVDDVDLDARRIVVSWQE
jgi:16S rRNA processing protein RimM